MSYSLSSANKNLPAELGTLFNLTNRGTILPERQKREKFTAIDKAFTASAYNDQTATGKLPGTDSNQCAIRFADFDAPNLVKVAKELGISKHNAYRLIANIMKVCNISTPLRNGSPPVHEIHIYEVKGDKSPLFWGWIEERYLRASEQLMDRQDETRVIFKAGEIEPSALLALQSLQETIGDIREGREVADLPYNLFVEAAIFGDEWNVEPMIRDLAEIRQMKMGQGGKVNEKKEHQRAMELYGPDRVAKALSKVDSIKEASSPVTVNPHFKTALEDPLDNIPIDTSSLIESANKFAGRACTLSPANRLGSFERIRTLFIEKCYEGETIDLPKKHEPKFVLITLPFLVKTMQSSAEERRQFLVAVQMVTKRSFPKLCPSDQVQVILHNYGTPATPQNLQLTWVPGDSGPSVKDPKQPLKVVQTRGNALSVLSGLSKASPEELVDALYFALDNELPGAVQEIEELLTEGLNDPSKATAYSDSLVRHLDHSKCKEIAKKGKFEISQDVFKNLTEEDLFLYFLFRIEGVPVERLGTHIARLLEPSGHLITLLQRLLALFQEKPDDMGCQQRIDAIQSYAKDRLIRAIQACPLKGGLTYSHGGANLVKKALANFKEYPSLFKDLGRRIKEISTEMQSNFLKDVDMGKIHQTLKLPQNAAFASLAGYENEVMWFLEGLESLLPKLKSVDKMEVLISNHLPELENAKDHPLYKALDALIKLSLAVEYPPRDFSANYPLSEEDVLKIDAVIAKDGNEKMLRYFFEESYPVRQLKFSNRMKAELECARSDVPSISERAFSFLLDISVVDFDPESMIIKHAIDSKESAAILALLRREGMRSAFHASGMERNYETAVRSMETFDASLAFAKDFIDTFKVPYTPSDESERELCDSFLFKLLQALYRNKAALSLKLTMTFGRRNNNWNYSYKWITPPEDFFLEAYFLASDPVVQNWLQEKGGAGMPQATVSSIKNGIHDFDQALEIKLFMVALKTKKLLSDQAIECLNRMIHTSLRYNEETPKEARKTIQLFTPVKKLTHKEIQDILAILNDEELTSGLKNEKTLAKIRELREVLPDVKIEPSPGNGEDDEQNGSSTCVLS